jgi:glucokinase
MEVNKDPLKVTSKMVYHYVKKNDPVAVKVNEIACNMLARAIGITLNTLAPDRVVLGGGVMMAGQIIIDTVSRYVPQYCWPAIWERCDIVIAELGEDAGVLGAGAMVFDEFGVK